MICYLLFSGGKDSSLAGIILKKLGFKVVAVNVTFGMYPYYRYAEEVSRILGFDFLTLNLGKGFLERIVEIIINEGVSRALNFLHKYSIEEVIRKFDAKIVADGIRRDDKVPKLSLSEIRSIEDRYDVEYLSPLLGIGYKTLRRLIDEFLIIKEDVSDRIDKSDYEAEIRQYMRDKGIDIYKYFPKEHKQSRVIGVKRRDISSL